MSRLPRVEPQFEDDPEGDEVVLHRRAIDQRAPRRRFPWLAWLLSITLTLLLVAGAGVAYLLWKQPLRNITTAEPAPAAATAVASADAPSNVPETTATAPSAKVEQIMDWFLICPADGTSACYMEQQLATKDAKGILFAWTVWRDAEGVAHATWRTPADVATNRGLTLDIGDGKLRTVPFAECRAGKCRVQAVLAPDYLSKLETAASISAIVVPAATGKPVRLPLSSRGFTEALARLAPRQTAP